MQRIFTCDGYDFWVDASGWWQVAHRGDEEPKGGACRTPEAIAKLKGVNLRHIEWEKGIE